MGANDLKGAVLSPSEDFQDLPIFIKWTDFVK